MTDTSSPAVRRVMVIGLDGATWDLITPWAQQGKLPHLAQLMAEGAHGPLASTVPPISAPAWTSFMTGVNPGKHGIYHFQEHIPNSYQARLVSGADVKAPTIWRILSEAGKSSISVNVAMTFPPERINGIVIAGVDAPGTGSQYTYPPELAKELEDAIGEYVIEPGIVEHTRRGRYDAAFQAILFALEQRCKAVEYLMSHKPWDLFVVNFRATDNIQHHFWHFMDPTHPLYDPQGAARYGDCILQVYQRLDEWIGALRRRLDADTALILVSDHGAGPATAKAVYFNRWLAQQGWLTFAGERSRSLAGRLRAGLMGFLWKSIWHYLRKWLGKRTKDTLRRLFPTLYDRARTPASYFAIDWAHTQAYSDEFREAIWINLRGREPQGIVSPGEEYERLRREIARRLSESLIDPETGEHIVERVYLREELYHGPYAEQAPDIFVQLREQPYYRTRLSHTTRRPEPVQTLSREELLEDFLPPGLHRSEGIILLAGPNIKAGVPLHNASIMDAAPTILHLLGLPVPSHMDGRVLVEALEHPGEVQYRDWGAGGPSERLGYSEEEEELVREKLAGLGYLG
jgi:predicted AlkP superfamily phosphohydrolase/phosphomutase